MPITTPSQPNWPHCSISAIIERNSSWVNKKSPPLGRMIGNSSTEVFFRAVAIIP